MALIGMWSMDDSTGETGVNQSHGLLAISQGLSRLFADDHEQLKHGMVLYDALYAWCNDT